jgi:hypothetical protein
MRRRFLNIIFITTFLSAPFALRADETNALAKSAILENNVLFFRIGEVKNDLPAEIQSAQNTLATTNKIAGTVLDLRFAGGDDLDSARAVENFFAQNKLPLAILVNGETRGAAIKLAMDLRAAHAGLIFGSAKDNLSPDILIDVKPKNESAFFENPYALVVTNESVSIVMTNDLLPIIDHTSEAELVRKHVKDGEDDEADTGRVAPEPFIRDPVLGRAVDFLKAEAIWRQRRMISG